MKNTQIEWIGNIPDDWDVKPISTCFKERNEKVSDYEWEPLSVTKQGVVKQLETAAKSDAHDDRKKVCKNDFVINSRSDRKQSCGVSPYNGSVSLINIVLENRKLNPKFVNYLLKNYGFAEEFYRYGSGIVADLWSTNYQKMKKIIIPIPPKEKQEKIASFLDEKVSEIDSVIQKTKQTIEDYKKYKQAIITETVTKGLDKFAERKDSNIDWIKEIPVSWQSMPLKSIFEFGKGLPITKADLVLKGNSVISYGQIHSKSNTGTSIDNNMIRYVSDEFLEEKYNSYKTQLNDFIFADTSEDLSGAGNCIYIDRENIFAGYHTIKLHPIKNKNYKYLAYLFLTDLWRSQLRSRVSGIKLFSITQKILKETTIILPTDEEMSAIVKSLDGKCEEINKIINSKQKIIEELEQYKKSLIYEYVTGKKEVI